MGSAVMTESEWLDSGNLKGVERDVESLLIPVEPPRAFRERLHQMLIAAASGTEQQVRLRVQGRIGRKLVSAFGVLLAVFVTLRSIRIFRRNR